MGSHVYRDRKMLKWLPFEALEAQGEYMGALYDDLEKEAMPSLSQDHYDAMQYRLEEALQEHATVRVSVFEAGRRHEVQGKVLGVDLRRRLLFLEGHSLALDAIVDLRL